MEILDRTLVPPRLNALVALAVMTAVGCGGGTPGDEAANPGAPDGRLQGDVLVSAAASLTDAFSELANAFEAAHPQVDVVLNLGGSSSLRSQILEGAPGDVFASADAASMDRVVDAGRVSGETHVFAHNTLRIAVPAGNPANVRSLASLADRDLRIGLCAEGVPCGEMARKALERAGVVPALDTNEPNVRALLNKIELGELDAGITYATDVASSRGEVEGIDIPDDQNVIADYLITVLAGASNPSAADAFVHFVLSDAGRSILARHGFVLP